MPILEKCFYLCAGNIATQLKFLIMENIGEGFLLGNYHLYFGEDEKKVLVKALLIYQQFCHCYSHVCRVYRDFSLCEVLLSKIR